MVVAAWVQAIFSVVALVVALGIAFAERIRFRVAEANRTDEFVGKLSDLAELGADECDRAAQRLRDGAPPEVVFEEWTHRMRLWSRIGHALTPAAPRKPGLLWTSSVLLDGLDVSEVSASLGLTSLTEDLERRAGGLRELNGVLVETHTSAGPIESIKRAPWWLRRNGIDFVQERDRV